ncbi:YegP family protein [Aureibaculum sp. 2210JD6-5]|uniref:YegP family protein n=1 Tax=Aureibaculum sp. 2210JD6-5 TaxID=3103957 RepID=UPI002AACCD26|nr:YegP family protein [Aureibaculum sp. 2210JD6-5]MDY7395010.1 YegP family protein [Aureibaculum sp. 2210JD6-5]
MAKFEIYNDKRDEFRFRLKVGNGQNILASEGYKAKSGCTNGIESVRKNSQDDSNYERLNSKNGSTYFNLKASNGPVIGTSEMYSSTSAMENGIASVKTNSPKASVDDLT